MSRFRLTLPEKIGWRDHVIGALIGTAYTGWLLATARSLGFARDEGFYFQAATRYADWFETLTRSPATALTQGAVDAVWSTNHEHPPLIKSLFALSWMGLHNGWRVFEDASTAFRFPAMVLAGVCLWIVYLFGARAYSRRAGCIAAALLGLAPHTFYNAHLACFDVPIMTMWTLCIYVYWRSVERGGLLWPLATGVAFGLALLTKHNAWILPAIIAPHAFFVHRQALARGLAAGLLTIPTSVLSMAIVGPTLFVLLWPWMWNDTFARIQEYVDFHVHHVYYNIEYLHINYFGPPSPRSYAPVLILATIPSITIVLFLIGGTERARNGAGRLVRHFLPKIQWPAWVANARGDLAETDLLFALSFCAALGPFFLPRTPIFGGTKHWLTAYPFLSLFAGRGFDIVADKLDELARTVLPRFANIARLLLPPIVVAPPLAITAHSHPFGMSTYVPFVGGVRGGASLGLNRQFWGYTSQNVEPFFAARARRHASVYIHDTAWESWARMLDEGRVRPDLRAVASQAEAEIAIYQHELHMLGVEYNIWETFGTVIPSYIVEHDGVPIVVVYAR
jgi:4-amino-4-deoxy-L-arabinose transferase-like glycosyltransferase